VPYSYPRKGVQSALDCRIQNAPPLLMPEKATSALVRPTALGRPRIPSRSSVPHALLSSGSSCSRALVTQNRWLLARPYARLSRRTAGCWLVLTRACHAKTAGCWLLLTRACHAKTAGCWLVLTPACHAKTAGCWLALTRACHAELLAAGSSLRTLVTQKPLAACSSLRAFVTQKPLAAGWSLRALVTQKPLAAGSSLRVLVTQNRSPAVRILGGVAWSSHTRIPLEFGCSRPVPHLWLTVLTVPRVQMKKT
jgi:hypothetical protein